MKQNIRGLASHRMFLVSQKAFCGFFTGYSISVQSILWNVVDAVEMSYLLCASSSSEVGPFWTWRWTAGPVESKHREQVTHSHSSTDFTSLQH